MMNKDFGKNVADAMEAAAKDTLSINVVHQPPLRWKKGDSALHVPTGEKVKLLSSTLRRAIVRVQRPDGRVRGVPVEEIQ